MKLSIEKYRHLLQGKSLWYAVLFVLTVSFLFLFIFQPFNAISHNFTWWGITRVLSYSLLAALTFYLNERWLFPYYQRVIATQEKTMGLIGWYGVQLVLISVAMFFCKNAWLSFADFSFRGFLVVLYRTFAIAFLPVLLFVAFFRNKLTSQNVLPVPEKLTLRADGVNEYLQLFPEELVMLKAADNYTDIFYQKGAQLQKKVLRGSLRYFEQQLTFPMFRCHRSFMINLQHIVEAKSNSRGYLLQMNQIPHPVKVSLSYKEAFEKNWPAGSSQDFSLSSSSASSSKTTS